MGLSYFFVVLLSSFCWTAFDVSRKQLSAQLSSLHTLALVMLLQVPLYTLWGLGFESLDWNSQYWSVGSTGLLVNFVANLLFVLSIRISPISVCIPMLSFAPAFAVLFSYLLLGEELLPRQFLGVGLVTVGALLIGGWPRFKAEQKGPWLMALAAAFWALMAVIDKMALSHASLSAHALFQSAGIALVALVLFSREKSKLNIWPQKQSLKIWACLGAMAALGAILLQLWVIRFVEVGLFESTKRALTMSFALLVGYVFYKERLSPAKIFAVALMSLGLYYLLI